MKRTVVMVLAGVVFLALAVSGLVYQQKREAAEAAAREEALQRAIALYQEKDYAGSLALLETIPADEIDDWHAHYYAGASHMMLKDYPAAAEALERALALKPAETGTLYALGVVYYKLGNLELAKSYFRAVLDIEPDDQHAKGLMDIMARLEREQPGYEGADAPPAGDTEQPDS